MRTEVFVSAVNLYKGRETEGCGIVKYREKTKIGKKVEVKY